MALPAQTWHCHNPSSCWDQPQTFRFSWVLGLLLAFLGGCSSDSSNENRSKEQNGADSGNVEESIPVADQSREFPEVSFVFWNVENFFDDKVGHHHGTADVPYDRMFSQHPELFQEKLDHLATVLLRDNNGRGPDIIGLAEVETQSRSVEALRDRLNQGLPANVRKYQHIQSRDPEGGRAIMTAVLSRIPLNGFRTTLWGKRLRILKTEVENPIPGKKTPLILVVSHWTSRVSDKDGDGRAKYGDQIHGQVRSILTSNPTADVLVCGDFNDNPDEPSVRNHLLAVEGSGDLTGGNSRNGALWNLFGNYRKDEPGTHYYSGHWFQFDQIAVSQGLLDGKGWGVVPDSQHVLRYPPNLSKKGHPQPFGSERHKGTRGASDHLPVGVKLRILPD